MIRIEMICQDTRHPDKRKRHHGRASCEVAGRRFEATGPAPIYRIATLLWLHGHSGAEFEVWDDLSPFGKPGGLAMRGKVRNWAYLVREQPSAGRRRYGCETRPVPEKSRCRVSASPYDRSNRIVVARRRATDLKYVRAEFYL